MYEQNENHIYNCQNRESLKWPGQVGKRTEKPIFSTKYEPNKNNCLDQSQPQQE